MRKCQQHRKNRRGTTAYWQLDKEDVASTDADKGELFAILSHVGMVGSVKPVKPLWWTFDCGGVSLPIQLDTGAPVSILTSTTYLKHNDVWPKFCRSKLQLSSFLGKLPVQGELHLSMSLGGETVEAVFAVFICSGSNLCGRDLITAFNQLEAPVLNSSTERDERLFHVNSCEDNGTVKQCLEEYADLFQPGLGLLGGPPAHLHLRERAIHKFCQAHPIPYALREKVNTALDRLVSVAVLSPVAS